jgi:hypothetical protein
VTLLIANPLVLSSFKDLTVTGSVPVDRNPLGCTGWVPRRRLRPCCSSSRVDTTAGLSGLYSTFGLLTDVFRSAQSALSPAGGERLMKKTRAGRAVSPATTDGTADTRNESRARGSFPIVGVGASAGGLEAFSSLLKHLPLDTGMGFILVQHLDPEHDSALTQLLGRATLLPVTEVTNNLRVEPNHVYVIPPNTNLSIADGVLALGPRPKTRTPHRSIDFFFEALAKDQRDCAIGVILSGTATDGTLGLEAIKAEGGITFAQDDSARYDSMPRSAVAAGSVDFILSPEDIATELARIAKHPAVAGAPTGSAEDRASATAPEDDETPMPSGRGTPRTGATRARAQRPTTARRRRSAPAPRTASKRFCSCYATILRSTSRCTSPAPFSDASSGVWCSRSMTR